MKVEIVEATDRALRAKVEGTSTAVMNTLRRTLMMEVPKLAIEDVTIYDNRSALFDEIIAHRLSMLPVPTDLQAFNFRASCTCDGEGCPNCTALFTLTFEGPGTVYARDLQPVEPSFAIAEPDVPIVKLGRDQRLMLEATAELGTGAAHAKWQPVIAAGFREVPTVKVKGKLGLDAEAKAEIEELAPPGSIVLKGDKIEVEDELAASDFLYNVYDRYGLEENVEFGVKEGDFYLFFETDGSLTPKQALREAIRLTMEKLKAVEEYCDELK